MAKKKKKQTFKVRYIGGSTTREMFGFVWNAENQYIQEVEIDMAAHLATYPGNQFELVNPEDDEPEIIEFVEGDPRPIEELKSRQQRGKRSSK